MHAWQGLNSTASTQKKASAQTHMQIFHDAHANISTYVRAALLCCDSGGQDGARTGYDTPESGLGCFDDRDGYAATPLCLSTDCVSAATVWFEWGQRTSAAAFT
ncbi:unnamed protein product [Laminaria digitata]